MKQKRGFTLIELMIVVVIIGVLSVLAVSGYRRYTFAARNAEAENFLLAIRAKQEAYFQAFGQYCGAPAGASNPDRVPFPDKVDWGNPEGAWRDLGIKAPTKVWFQYWVYAGRAGQGAPGMPGEFETDRPWFVARAHGDFDGTREKSTFEISSQRDDVWRHKENE